VRDDPRGGPAAAGPRTRHLALVYQARKGGAKLREAGLRAADRRSERRLASLWTWSSGQLEPLASIEQLGTSMLEASWTIVKRTHGPEPKPAVETVTCRDLPKQR